MCHVSVEMIASFGPFFLWTHECICCSTMAPKPHNPSHEGNYYCVCTEDSLSWTKYSGSFPLCRQCRHPASALILVLIFSFRVTLRGRKHKVYSFSFGNLPVLEAEALKTYSSRWHLRARSHVPRHYLYPARAFIGKDSVWEISSVTLCMVAYICCISFSSSVDFVLTCFSFLLPSQTEKSMRPPKLDFWVLLLFKARSYLNRQVVFSLQTYFFTKAHWFSIFAGNCHYVYAYTDDIKRFIDKPEGHFFSPERGTWLSATEQTFILREKAESIEEWNICPQICPPFHKWLLGKRYFYAFLLKPVKRQCIKNRTL